MLTHSSTDERNVYLAIAQHYLVQFMPEKAYQEVSVAIQCGDESFCAVPEKQLTADLRRFLARKPQTKVNQKIMMIPLLNCSVKFRTGETLTTKEVVVNEKKTTPPPLFTEASLLAALVRVADFVTDQRLKELLKDKDKDKR